LRILGRIFAITSKEFVQLQRDRLTGGMIVGIPALQLLLFGFAINTDVRHLPAGVADLADTQASRALVAAAQASQVIDVVVDVESALSLETLMRQGRIGVGLYIPQDFEDRIERRDRAPAQILVDASDPTLLQVARTLTELPIPGRFGIERTSPTPRRPGESLDRVPPLELRPFYNPERRSAVQIVPALIGVILTLTMSLFTAVAIVRERERGTLELLITTPVRSAELMVGKLLPYVLIGLVQVTIILVMARLLFRVPIVGSLADVYAASGIFIAATLTLGLLISTAAKTQFQAFQLTMFAFLPSMLLSGFMFPFDGMPPFAQQLGELLPLTHFTRMIRGIVLRGATLDELSREIWPLAIFFAVTLTLAMLRFRKRLD
jgi:ABC-2 type transport system permease protein